MSQLTFDQFVGGIEDGMILALKTPAEAIGVQKVVSYSGDLDAESLKEALSGNAAGFPKIMISYGNGQDVQDPKISALPGKPVQYRHECWFTAIVASNDPRSEKIRRRGTPETEDAPAVPGCFQMMELVRKKISGLTIKNGSKMLTFEPLKPLGTHHGFVRVPNVTAYAIIFGTYFRWISEDTTTTGVDVSELILDVESLNDHPSNYTQEIPGVRFE